ncbi:methylmalonyl-CoA mutase metallochaperone MeaB [Roseivirga pacifica]|uniref:Methylmalonyl-CoA mutase metallochaperone MeaB n=1 Tax=Roseivirga pacifica TaxID=1267423 RepID=A0A1I0MMT7_9BACT|nr:methylmalonyl Co-A mutase-associated GTPase MeaB [Roseivirga pacifica]RKQ50551.1 methylmalonyl-CoA mutase metallochaperone MeaB [Roseivirga pacifica]SEV89846.1 methylmalonyl-CoA mutase metallochaperone MeaB [Roseivirga pacifica]
MKRKNRLSKAAYVEGILAGDRLVLSRAITLVESTNQADLALADEVLSDVLPHTGKAMRVGITGVPGVGKSTFIEAFGSHLTSNGQQLAVLTIDPSSQKTKGSILGDKTRMEELARDPNAFIRPSASGSTLGGVSNKTREVMLLCEAAGFDVILIETVGVGQSETLVHGMVDFFLLLMLAGAGDELQGIKKGIMEMAHAVVINKADGDNLKPAKRAKVEYQNALHLFPADPSGWVPQVKICSARDKTGIAEVWEMMQKHSEQVTTNGFLQSNRQAQQLSWFKENVQELLGSKFYRSEQVKAELEILTQKVKAGEVPALKAAHQLVDVFFGG